MGPGLHVCQNHQAPDLHGGIGQGGGLGAEDALLQGLNVLKFPN